MKMSMTGHMRMEQRMKLAPRMIQSMEVLQLPLLALQEKIEAELNSNPVLEVAQDQPEDGLDRQAGGEEDSQVSAEVVDQRELVVEDNSNNVEDFQRLETLGEIDGGFSDHLDSVLPYRIRRGSDEPDRKLEALRNTAANEKSLNDHLIEQWRLVEAQEPVKQAGSLIIDYIDEKGYLTVRVEQLHNKDKH
ncbi:MAG: hypothetical protein KAR47_00860, partial [Planctomycetes bacterium]|nr:hypothetical protein [Planctomycetota bacterium]